MHAADSLEVQTNAARFERLLVAANRTVGGIIVAFGLLLLFMWWTGRDTDRHGMVFVWLGAQAIGPIGTLFLVAARAIEKRWRFRWAWQALPFLYPFAFAFAFARLIL